LGTFTGTQDAWRDGGGEEGNNCDHDHDPHEPKAALRPNSLPSHKFEPAILLLTEQFSRQCNLELKILPYFLRVTQAPFALS
jgi:hypothetical protein